MSAISPVLPSPDELDKVNQVERGLKRYPDLERSYFASDSAIPGLREFYSEIAQAQGQDLESAYDQALVSLKEVIDAFKALKRIQSKIEKVAAWAGTSSETSKLSEIDLKFASDKQTRKFYRIITKFYKIIIESYDSMTNAVKTSWDYLPVELQEPLESMARQVILCLPRAEGSNNEASTTCLSEAFLKVNSIYSTFAVSVFAAVEASKSKPKLQLLELFRGWDFSHNIAEHRSIANLAMDEIQELAENLVALSGIEQVEAITYVSGDLHRVTFHLKLSPNVDANNGFDNLEDLWEVAEKMALRAHRRLRKSTGEKWYFHTTLDEGFSDYPNSNNVVAVAHAQFNNPYSAS